MGQIQPFVQRVRTDISSGVKRAGREFDHKPPSTRLRICGAIPLPGHTPSQRAQGNISSAACTVITIPSMSIFMRFSTDSSY